MDGWISQCLGARFVLRNPVGSGGMATVYRAIDRHTGDTVAVKLLHAGDPSHLARFALEVGALASLDHPAVVRLLAHGKWPDGRPSLAMEWLEGEDLATRLDRGYLEPREVVTLCLRVAEALAAVHARGIIHRDIKPGNIFLPGGSAERVKLIDFGISRLSGHAPITATGAVMGTPGYMAPEQAAGETNLDARADLFSLGAVMFECLTGRPPFVAEHAMAVLARILFEQIPAVKEVCPHVPEALSSLVARMLSKGREARPESAAEVAGALAAMSREAHTWPPPRERASQPLAPAGRERRFTTVVVVRPRGAPREIDAAAAGEPTWPCISDRLGAAVTPLGARIASLMNGVQLMTWLGSEDPSEQTTRAARCALIAREIEPEATIVLASGFSDPSEPRAVWHVLDHAASLLFAEDPSPGRAIRIDATTAGLLDPRFRVLQAPSGWELAGEGEFGAGARTLLGRASPYVGRARELRALLDAVDACVEDRTPASVLITAPAGMGKSRLAKELCRRLDSRFSLESMWLGRGDCMTAGSAFVTLGTALRATAGVCSHEPLSKRQEELAARVARSVPEPERARITAFLGELVGAPFTDDRCALLGPARESAAVMAERIRQAWLDFVDAECAAHPVLIVLDDLHWGDKPSIDLLDAMLGELPGRPVLVLALARPEVHDTFPRLWANRSALEIRLASLSPAAASMLVHQMLGDSIDAALAARIIERAEGNAFYLEEMIRAVADGRSDALPDTVLAMVQARLDVLSVEERAVLRAASVLGETFWQRGVEALLDGGPYQAQVSTCLKTIISREILTASRVSRFPGEKELAFRHALLRDGAYALWAESDRRAAHLRAAEWLEEVGEDDAVMLAEHFEQGDAPDRSNPYRVVAAQRLLAGNDLSMVIAHAERCHLGSMTRELRLLHAQVLTEAHWLTGDIERAAVSAEHLIELAPAGTDPWCTSIGIKMMLALTRGRADELLSIIATFMGAQLVDQCADSISRVYSVMSLLVSITGLRGPTRYFLDMASQSAADDPPDPTTQWFLCTARAQWNFFFEADFAAALKDSKSALFFCKQAGQRKLDAFNHGFMGWIYFLLGAFDLSEEHARRAMDATDLRGHAGLVGCLVLSWVSTYRGAFAEGARLAKSAIEAAEGNVYMQGMAHGARGYVLFSGDEHEEAERELTASLELLSSSSMLRSIPLVQLAAIDLARGRASVALSAIRPVLEDAGSAPPHPGTLSHAQIIQVEALEALGDRPRARAALAEARRRILATANKLDDPALRSSFLQVSPWTSPLFAKSAQALEHDESLREVRSGPTS
jgi:eukaryotic-like serine/threonine-protein kinase